ncbi:hypothetical protein ACFS7Z_25845 [Pontibacter toksunensis]|uniref:DUF4382 domain-containing protein n=1 Tax=Pontibacter toksunensis TaxID=1332631 RepID=A0ABW6C268_9BACT
MKLISPVKHSAILVAGYLLLSSCETEEVERTSANVAVEATASPLTAAESQQGRIVLTDFRINMKEVEFEFDKADARSATEVSVKDVKLKGPFELDLLNPNGSLSAIAATVVLPNAVYEQVGFKTHKGTSGVMLDKAVLMAGNVDGVPFEFWHDMDEEFDVDFADANQDLVVNGHDQALTIDYKISTLLGTASGVDLSAARDGNGDGRIEISPKDTDGNQELAKDLRDSLRSAIKLMDDK